MDQRLSSGPRMPDSLNGEGALRKALDGPIDGRARKTSNTGDDGNTSSSQSLAIEGCNQVLLSLIEVRKQQGVLPLKFFGFAHSRIIPSPPWFVTINFLRALTVFALMTNEPQLMKAITEVQEALTAAIAAVRQGRPLPQECFVPDLWHYREEFAHDEGMELFDHVSAGFWIAHHFYGRSEHTFRNGVKGWRFFATTI